MSGINPFNIFRADEDPRPMQFPAFLRFEMDHNNLLSGLLANQAEERGANAVINVRFATSSVAQGAAELFAYGTAVKVE